MEACPHGPYCRLMRSRAAWQALTRWNLLATGWPWRSVAYLLTSVLVGAVTLVVVLVCLAVGAVLALVVVGIPFLVVLGLSGIPVAALERRRLRIIDSEPVESPHREPDRPGLRAWARLRFGEQATWRELAYTGLLVTVLWPMELMALIYGIAGPALAMCAPIVLREAGEVRLLKFWLIDSYPEALLVALLGAVLLVLFTYPLTVLAVLHGLVARALLAPRQSDEARRVVELTRSRSRLVDAFEAERRRIERDLHDGAQQRLVSLTMKLGLARLTCRRGRGRRARRRGARAGQARAGRVARTHPRDPPADPHRPGPARRRSPTSPIAPPFPVDGRHRRLPRGCPSWSRPPRTSWCAEALANVAKHSGRTGGPTVAARLARRPPRRGDQRRRRGRRRPGAGQRADRAGRPGRGRRRQTALSSPVGGPTLLRVEIPCTDRSVGSPRRGRRAAPRGLAGLLARFGHRGRGHGR